MSSPKNLTSVLLFSLVIAASSHSISAQQIVGSDRHASLLCADGAVFSWGENRDGRLGDGTTTESNVAVRSKVTGIKSITGRYAGVVAVDESGDVYAWGGVEQNQFGMPSWEWIEPLPKQVMHVSRVKKAIANAANAYLCLQDENLLVSGENSQGQYGNGSTIRLDSGSSVVPIDSIVDIFCAVATLFVVRTNGTVVACGSNGQNQIDSTAKSYYETPKEILHTNGIVSSSGTFGFSNNLGSMRVVTVDGDVYVWGQNDMNQLGVPNQKRVITPTKLSLPKKVTAITGGLNHTVALCNDGTVLTWGDNYLGQLGNPYQRNSVEPVVAIGLSGVVAIGAGSNSSYAITSDGTLYGWGDNTYRQLNLDGAPFQYTPVPLPLPCSLVSDVQTQQEQSTQIISPNPAHDFVTVTMPAAYQGSSTTVSIFSVHGELVLTQGLENAHSKRINISSLPAGTYHAHVTVNGTTLHSMLVKIP